MEDLTKIAWEVAEDCINKIKLKTGIRIKIDDIQINSRAYRVWGKANVLINPDSSYYYTITISKVIFVKDSALFRKTIAHEVAHLADFQLYDGWGHGKSWRKVMTEFLGLDDNTLVVEDEIAEIESMGVVIPPRRRQKKHMYLCKCGQKWAISGRVHSKNHTNQVQGYVCARCHSSFVYSGKTERV
jgi:predicted SprT family Zn-dependent metalloprotease